MKINNPYLTIINAKTKYNTEAFKSFKYEKVNVIAGDWGKSTALLEQNAKNAYDNVLEEFNQVGIKCELMSAKRNGLDQIYAQGETFAIKLNKSANQQVKEQLNLEDSSTITTIQKLKAIIKHPKLVKIAYQHQKKYAARVGHSEHHSGLAIDIKVDMTNVQIPDKIKSRYPDANQGTLNFITRRMIMEKYGFIQTYPKSPRIESVTGMPEHEAWHWRYIGAEHSQRIARLREIVGEDIFLEDYVQLLQYDIKAESEKDLLDQFANLFKTKILHLEDDNTLSL